MFCHTTTFCFVIQNPLICIVIQNPFDLYCHTKPTPKKNLKNLLTLLRGWSRLDTQ